MADLGDRLNRLFRLDGANRITSMEGLRGLAVILVFLVHYHSCFAAWMAGQPQSGVADFLQWTGRVGVDLFFVLSGYVIYGGVLDARAFSYRTFMGRRLRRLYPAFAVVLAAYLALSVVFPGESKLPPGWAAASVYVIANALMLPGMFAIPPIISVAWSLSYEMFFYLVVPLVVAALRLPERSVRFRVLVMVAIASGVGAAALLGAGHVQMMMFVSGMLVYEAARYLKAKAVAAPGSAVVLGQVAALAALPGAYVLVLWVEPRSGTGAHVLRSVWLFAALGLAVFAALQRGAALERLCSTAPLRALGNMSYSYYLVLGAREKRPAPARQNRPIQQERCRRSGAAKRWGHELLEWRSLRRSPGGRVVPWAWHQLGLVPVVSVASGSDPTSA